jgi:hypothetical protein
MPCGLSHSYVPRKGVHAAACPFKTSPLRPQDGGGRVSPGSGVYTAHALASSVGPQDKILASGPSHISRASRDVTFSLRTTRTCSPWCRAWAHRARSRRPLRSFDLPCATALALVSSVGPPGTIPAPSQVFRPAMRNRASARFERGPTGHDPGALSGLSTYHAQQR